jgi:hypothetical protein
MAFDEYLNEQVMDAIRHWDPQKPRRWLAKYGNLTGILSGENAPRYRALKEEARALTARRWTREQGDHMPEVTYRIVR